MAFGATACGRHVFLGGSLGDAGNTDAGNGILWRALFESGDVSEWTGDGKGGIYMDPHSTAPAASAYVAHRGRFSGIATFAPTSPAAWSYLYRDQPSPPDAYYGAWFFIPASLQINSWLSLHHFGYHQTEGASEVLPVWDFHVYPTANGTLAARLYESSSTKSFDQSSPLPVAPATWVHFELRFRKAADATGQITVWQDETQILDVTGIVTAPTEWGQWDAGGGSNDATPSPASVYVDDATISLARVGTGFF
jgi:hypothetical protein